MPHAVSVLIRALAVLAVLTLLGCASRGAPTMPSQPDRVLFVGNSLTYVGNVPAVFSALAAANGRTIASDMIVRGGATLTQRVADGSVAQALGARPYKAVVLQERGGDLTCSFGPTSCVESRQAIKALAAMGKQRGVTVVLLGTYQPHPGPSKHLVKEESAAAAQASIAYLQVSEKLQQLRKTAPELTWFAVDGAHPGKDLALLNAVVVYQALTGSLPDAKPLTVSAPIYGMSSGLKETLRPSDAPPPLPNTPDEVHYSAKTLEVVLTRFTSY